MFEGGHFPSSPGDPAMTAFVLVVGAAMLVVGRRLFWLAVALLGFGAAFYLTETLFGEPRRPWIWLLALAAGVLGSILAVTLQRIAVVVGGFFLGVLGSSYVLARVGYPGATGTELLVLLVGGLLLALVASKLFALALSCMTAGAGSALVVFALRPDPPFDLLLFGGLWLAGFVVQSGRKSREPGSGHSR